MRTPPTNWNTLMAQPHETETRIDIAGTSYYGFDGESGIYSCTTHPMLFDKMSVGNCCSSQIDLTLVNPQNIPRMAQMDLYVRLNNGTLTTTWVRKGTYYIDTREWDAQHEFLTITGYDAMLKAEQYYYTPPATITGWPKVDTAVVSEICQRIGVQLDSRTTLNKGYKVRMPSVSSDGKGSNTLREVLKWIGAAYGGNWCITDEGKLRLVPLVPTNTPIAIGTDAIDLNTSPQYDGIGIVHLIVGEDGEEYTAGSTGREIEVDASGMHFENEQAGRTMAANVLSALQGYAYQPLTVTTAYEADPLWELGDKITVNGFTSQIAEMPTAFGLKYTVDVTAGAEDEIDHEYPFQGTDTQIERKIASSVASIKIDIDSIDQRVTTAEGAVSSLTLSVGNIEANVKDEDGKYTVLNLKSDGLHIGNASGTTTIDGSSITAGSVIAALVSADNITAGTMDAGDINLNGAFLIKNNDVNVAVVGAAQGLDASGNTTYGAVLQSIDGSSYAIVTNAGVRLQSGSNRIVVTGNSVTCNGVPIGQAVFGA